MSPRLNLRSVSSKRGEFAKCLLMPATRQPALYRSVLSQRSCTSGLPVSVAAACATPDAETAARHAADRPATADIRRLKLEFPDFILARSYRYGLWILYLALGWRFVWPCADRLFSWGCRTRSITDCSSVNS